MNPDPQVELNERFTQRFKEQEKAIMQLQDKMGFHESQLQLNCSFNDRP